MKERAAQDGTPLNFAGAGAYEHHIPAAVWAIVARGEFYSAYTPYQAEASQGTLQLIYEYQTMMTRLTGMDVSNASLYDGATALAEAVLMAERACKKGPRRVLVPKHRAPGLPQDAAHDRRAAGHRGRRVRFLPDGAWPAASIRTGSRRQDFGAFTALVIPQPNFFGVLEDVDALTDWAHANGALVIGVVNPVSLAVLKPPGEWGSGSGKRAPTSSAATASRSACRCRRAVRTSASSPASRNSCARCRAASSAAPTDLDGKRGFALTLQAREQHIRRAKATSNICTNQGLLVTAATITMAMLGPEGVRRIATNSMANTRALRDKLTSIPGVRAALRAHRFPRSRTGVAQAGERDHRTTRERKHRRRRRARRGISGARRRTSGLCDGNQNERRHRSFCLRDGPRTGLKRVFSFRPFSGHFGRLRRQKNALRVMQRNFARDASCVRVRAHEMKIDESHGTRAGIGFQGFSCFPNGRPVQRMSGRLYFYLKAQKRALEVVAGCVCGRRFAKRTACFPSENC